jgi:CBS domain-containing protein
MSPRAAARLESLGFSQVYDYVAGKMDWAAMGWPTEGKVAERPRAGDLARKSVPTCHLDERVGDVRARTEAVGWNVCLVVSEGGILLGRLRQRVLEAESDALVEQVMEEGPTTIRPNTELEAIIRRMQNRKVATIVVTRADGTLIGILYRKDGEEKLAE